MGSSGQDTPLEQTDISRTRSILTAGAPGGRAPPFAHDVRPMVGRDFQAISVNLKRLQDFGHSVHLQRAFWTFHSQSRRKF